jgi:hypothetical protein
MAQRAFSLCAKAKRNSAKDVRVQSTEWTTKALTEITIFRAYPPASGLQNRLQI